MKSICRMVGAFIVYIDYKSLHITNRIVMSNTFTPCYQPMTVNEAKFDKIEETLNNLCDEAGAIELFDALTPGERDEFFIWCDNTYTRVEGGTYDFFMSLYIRMN